MPLKYTQPTETINEKAGLSLLDNSQGLQAPVTDLRMDMDPPTVISTTKPIEKGKTSEKTTNDGRAKRSLEDFKITLEPFTPPSLSPEKKKKKKANSNKLITNPPRTDSWPRYLVIKPDGEESFKTVSPFAINKCITQTVGPLKNVRKLQSGCLMVECETKQQSDKALTCKSLCGFTVTVEPHRFLNYSRGVITCRDLIYATDDEIKDGMKSQGVIDVRRFLRKEGETLTQTGTFLLTFNRPELPESVNAAYHRLKIRPYYPPPLRCFKCQKFGHPSARCTQTDETCFCGHPKHESLPCPKPKKCPNCGLDHEARSKECKILKIEKEVQVLRTQNRDMSYRQAYGIVTSRSYVRKGTFAQATENSNQNTGIRNTKTSVSIATQTTPTTPTQITPTPYKSQHPNIPNPHSSTFPLPTTDLPAENPNISGTSAALSGPLFAVGSAGLLVPEKSDEEKNEGFWETPKKKRGWPKGKPRGSAKIKNQDSQTETKVTISIDEQ